MSQTFKQVAPLVCLLLLLLLLFSLKVFVHFNLDFTLAIGERLLYNRSWDILLVNIDVLVR